MEHPSKYEVVSPRTVDGTSISALLYTVNGTAPAVIMSHGFNCVKEMTLPEVAEAFQTAGFNALLYDARSVGASDGTPRNMLDPLKMAEDLSDLYTYVAQLPNVDSRHIFLWGMSFGGVVSATTAAIDRRAKAVVMVCPLFTYVQPHKADRAYNQLIKDRVSQLRGNDPLSVAPFSPTGDNAIGMGGAGGPGGLEAYNLMRTAAAIGHPTFRDRITFQTYAKLALYRPMEYMDMLRAPTMMIIPELDNISAPEEQRVAFDRIQSPKKLYLAKGKGHLDIATGHGSKEMIAATVEFFREIIGGSVI